MALSSTNENIPNFFFNFSCGFKENELRLFLKDSSKEKAASSKTLCEVTINDLIPEKIKEFECFFRDRMTMFAKLEPMEDFIESINEPKKKICVQMHVQLSEAIYIEHFVELRWKGFTSGKSLMKVSLIYPDNDKIFREWTKQILGEKKVRSSSLKREEFHLKLKAHNFQNNVSPALEKMYDKLKSFDTITSQVIQIKFFNKIVEKLKKPLVDLDAKDLETCVDILTTIVAEEQNEKTHDEEIKNNAADLAFSKLLEEESKSSKSKKHKTKRKSHSQKESFNKKEEETKTTSVSFNIPKPSVNPLAIRVSNLNSLKPLFTLHARILRWMTSNLDKIREFEDDGKKKYQQLSNKKLMEMKHNHCLIGIERLISDSNLSETYAFSYNFIDKHGNNQTGKGFYVQKLSGNKKESGIIYLGVDHNVIYHAMFEPLTDKILVPKSLAKVFEVHEKCIPLEEEKWDQVSFCTFSLIEKNVIQMDIGQTKEGRVTYQLYPLK